ncbi:MAG: carbon-phosphorus lyase complex subunit PhnI, partial [Gammaproteobacteria bacterium]|nr:carbon-phosphorus lyase complex subunit PhnI [Gammaproteobacteria bacterium]
MYVAVKGGEQAIDNAHALLERDRRGDPAVREIEVAQIEQQLGLMVDRVMSEGALYDRELAALAIKQARGDAVEAIFLLRAWRTTLTRFGYSEPVDTARMRIERRISAAFKDIPGGQLLGPTFDYTHRLLDFSLSDRPCFRSGSTRADALGTAADQVPVDRPGTDTRARVLDLLCAEGLVRPERASER